MPEAAEDDPLPTAVALAAQMIGMGLPGWEFLQMPDPVDRVLVATLTRQMRFVRERQNDALATAIANRVWAAVRFK